MAEDHRAADDSIEFNLDAVQSLEAFARACDRLRGARSYAELGRAARPRSLPAATLSDLLNAKSTPTRETTITFLVACGIEDDATQRSWLAALERVATSHKPRPPAAVRVEDARVRLLGVHAAIQVPGAVGELPPYVLRDLDTELRATITAAAERGGFVLLVGGSSVGKTRTLVEAVRAVLPQWWLLHPADVTAINVYAANPTPRTVLWLDELQRYLNHPAGPQASKLTADGIRKLVAAGTAVVSTLWPEEYAARTEPREPNKPDPYSDDRELLRIAHVIDVPDMLSAAERLRGEVLATDQRIRAALDDADAGFTQVMAAGPALIRHWEQAPTNQCYGKAVITAALDARRVGAEQSVTRSFLEAVAPAYLTPAQQATATRDWLDQALTYATKTLHGAASTLSPLPAGMGRIAGYSTADYLYQHFLRIRRTIHPADQVWRALVDNHHPDDTLPLISNAIQYGRATEALSLCCHALNEGKEVDHHDVESLIDLLLGLDRLNEAVALLSNLASTDRFYNEWLAALLEQHNRINEAVELMRGLAVGNRYFAHRLVNLLADHNRSDEIIAEVAVGTPGAAEALQRLLALRPKEDDEE
ncbi:hypothetical protein [Catellatospora sichuanensis]|uniref:hypothetical protein n=1 Tax=Catellatospora sichuanensis TaxID=1969805 RepID=UPI001182519F|nr:hypothetical protein [Catellatospora sichuanensis]